MSGSNKVSRRARAANDLRGTMKTFAASPRQIVDKSELRLRDGLIYGRFSRNDVDLRRTVAVPPLSIDKSPFRRPIVGGLCAHRDSDWLPRTPGQGGGGGGGRCPPSPRAVDFGFSIERRENLLKGNDDISEVDRFVGLSDELIDVNL